MKTYACGAAGSWKENEEDCVSGAKQSCVEYAREQTAEQKRMRTQAERLSALILLPSRWNNSNLVPSGSSSERCEPNIEIFKLYGRKKKEVGTHNVSSKRL